MKTAFFSFLFNFEVLSQGSKVLALAKKVATLIYSREWFCSATLKALSRELTALATPGL